MRLAEQNPHLNADALVLRFTPPPRFADASFETYVPDPAYASQQTALESMRAYASADAPQQAKRSFLRRKAVSRTQGRYMDGGFGVGKTHLLASLWHAWPGPKAYVTFTELTAFIGFAGMANAVKSFSRFELICIDEFELDDIANTLMVVSFLRARADAGPLRIAVTSNTLPDKLGEQRFSASEFRREISAIASYFDELKIDGNDFRSNHKEHWVPERLLTQPSGMTTDNFDTLLAHLRRVHPVQYGALLDGVDGVVIDGLHTIANQDDALLFVQLVDKLYDANIAVTFNGCAIDDVFAADYRHGGYRKKYGRAESRMAAMASETK